METMTDNRVDSLYVDSVDAKPRDFSWETETNEDYGADLEGSGITWSFVEHRMPEDGDEAQCSECGQTITYSVDEWTHQDTEDEDHDPRPDAEYHEGCEGPMMNYWYPVEIRDMDTAADLLADLPLCPVTVGGETGIALTGGGMDLSWEICEAYIRLGHLPPFHFVSQLPAMATRWTDGHELVYQAGRRTCEVMAGWVARGLERLEQTAQSMKERVQ